MNRFLTIISICASIATSSASSSAQLLSNRVPEEDKSFAIQFAEYLGILSFTSVLAIVSPLILKIALMPLFLMLKLICKPFVMIGLTGWLMVAFTPLILAKSGMTSPVFETRSQSNGILSSLSRLMSTNMSVIVSEAMNFFDLDNDECKLEMSCRFGKRIANHLPYIQYFALQSGASNWIENPFMAKLFRSMTEATDCVNTCPSLTSDDQKSYSSASYSSDTTSDSSNNVFEWLG